MFIGLSGLAGLIAAGCRDQPPPQVPVPTAYNRDAPITRRDDGMKPLPAEQIQPETYPPFYDAPLISQQPPEQPAFVDAYRQVGAPRILLVVNRTLDGNPVPVDPNDQVISSAQNAGQFDEASTRSIDYQAIESIMTEWLACNGQVTIISPTMARQQNQQVGAEIMVQVQARPTRQTQRGMEFRIIAEAINTKGGESIARAMVDVPPPLEKTQINVYTRFLTRKLMDGMLGAWSAPPPPTPTTQP
jgi:hypothetical protein